MRSDVIKLSGLKIFFLIMTVAIMIIIFIFSSENSDESSSRSGGITETVIKLIVSDFDDLSPEKQADIMDTAEHIIRKLAHFSVYMALGFSASCTVGKRRFLQKSTLFTLLFCFTYACTDELHQYFVPGRSCQFTDVLIDTSGALLGILISMVIFAVSGLKHNNEKAAVNN